LVGQLNGTPFLSKDRLTRVKKSICFNNSEDYLNAAQCSDTCFVGIGSDVGVYFVQRSTITRPSTVAAAKKRGRCRLGKSGRQSQLRKLRTRVPGGLGAYRRCVGELVAIRGDH